MSKNLIIIALSISLVLAIWRPDFQRLIGNKAGELSLLSPPPKVLDNAALMTALATLSISPHNAVRLAAKDRMPYLRYIQQVCAVAEMPSIHPFYTSANIDVWRIMQANFPQSKPWFADPAIVQQGMVDVKAIAPKVLQLVP